MRRFKILFCSLLLLITVGWGSRLWAVDPSTFKDPDSMESDGMDDGAGDDKADAGTEKSKFQKDSDDAYEDNTAADDDKTDSRFKEDRQGDEDGDWDKSDQG